MSSSWRRNEWRPPKPRPPSWISTSAARSAASEAGDTLVTAIVGVWGVMLTVAVVVAPLGQVDWMTHGVPLAPFTLTETELPEIVHGPDRTDRVAPAVTVGVKLEP